jgi:putative two-component system response regulator
MQGTQVAALLLVDDAPENLSVLSELLRSEYQVCAATSGETALRMVNSLPRPDLILLDVMMPDMNGCQVIASLRADAATRDIPVIFATAMDSTEAEMQGLQAGAVDYITKPIIPPIVLARIYKPAMRYEEALETIIAGRGKHFEPGIADVFVENFSACKAITEERGDLMEATT